MRVTSLKLANVRAIEAAEFQFRRSFNLLVGVNGVGKTSTLDALCVCLSAFMKRANKLNTRVGSFRTDDIRDGANALTVECGGQIHSSEHRYLIHRPRDASAPREKKSGMPREQVHVTPEKASFLGSAPLPVTGGEPGGRPLAVLFSTNRAGRFGPTRSKQGAAGGTVAAFADVFKHRELLLREIVDWFRVQQALRAERKSAGRVLDAVEQAVVRFLPGYSNVRIDPTIRQQLVIDHDQRTVAVRKMSDGERGTLAVVLDLTRRLAQANPEMADPAAEAEAVVLIDELELHLHPKWQRQIVRKLTETFPRCQFIATSHSPQIVASVNPGQIHLLTPTGVVRPDRSRGVDSNWILRHLMEADDRPEDAKVILKSVERSVAEGEFAHARDEISRARQDGFDLPEWSVLEVRIARLEVLAE